MAMEDIFFSLVVPVYNLEEYVEKCLRSVLNQSYNNYEVIVTNDGSSDRSGEIIDKIASEDKRIIVIHQENTGVSSARNNGLENAKGDYIVFLDGDDWIEKDCLAKLAAKAKETDADVVVYEIMIEPLKGEPFQGFVEQMDDSLIDGQQFFDKILTQQVSPAVINKMFRRSIVTDNNIRFPLFAKFGEDPYFLIKFCFVSNSYTKLNETIYHYQGSTPGGALASYDDRRRDIHPVFEGLEKFLMEKNLYDKYQTRFEYLKYKHVFEFQVLGGYHGPLHKYMYKKGRPLAKAIKKNPYYKRNHILIRFVARSFVINFYLGKVMYRVVKFLYDFSQLFSKKKKK